MFESARSDMHDFASLVTVKLVMQTSVWFLALYIFMIAYYKQYLFRIEMVKLMSLAKAPAFNSSKMKCYFKFLGFTAANPVYLSPKFFLKARSILYYLIQ